MRWSSTWFHQLDVELAQTAECSPGDARLIRRALAQDPVAFAMIYLGHHLRGQPGPDGEPGPITFAETHLEWARLALDWRRPASLPAEWRHAFMAPRNMGKSTWWFLILPMWAAANDLIHFAVAFAHADEQAKGHLQTFKHELDTNTLLRFDYPDLCAPLRRPSSGTTVADRQGMIHQRSGFVMAGKGVDSQSLGMKVGAQRPDLIILDDVEPDEAKYSRELAEKRLGTIIDAILPLNIRARAVWSGTVTMPGSLTHQLVKSTRPDEEPADWIKSTGFVAHHHLPILVDPDGTERSAWPAKWPIDWLQARRRTREYAKNYANDPMARDGAYWRSTDFRYVDQHPVEGITRWMLAVDQAVTSKDTSDQTGLAVLGWRPPKPGERDELGDRSLGQVLVAYAAGVRLPPDELRLKLLEIIRAYPAIGLVLVETNQGGENWGALFHHLPSGVRLASFTSTAPKEVRAANVLAHYQRGRVIHARRLSALEEQMVGFPLAPHDDLVDAVGSGVDHFLSST